MLWALPLGMAALGAVQQENQRKRDQAYNAGQAEVTRYSPWTNIHGEIHPSSASALNGAIQGGVSGALLAQQFGGGSAKPSVTPEVADSSAGGPLGSGKMSNEMQAMSNNVSGVGAPLKASEMTGSGSLQQPMLGSSTFGAQPSYYGGRPYSPYSFMAGR